jgi:enhancing lycopene biosynthesis protein 2
MNKKIAVILSGCGVYDGAEIQESVLTLLRLDQRGAVVQCFAPNVAQLHVVDHYSGDEMDETRNVLVESARISRGQIKDVKELHVGDFDAVILPGGFGVAKNLSDFVVSGANCNVQADVLSATQAFVKAGKPVGLMCIAPALAAKIFGAGVICTIGKDHDTAAALTQMGAEHHECEVSDIVEDAQHKLVTTPAYMLAQSISEAAAGINKLVDRVLELSHPA